VVNRRADAQPGDVAGRRDQVLGGDDALDADEALGRRLQQQVVEVQVGAGEGGVAPLVAHVHVDQGGVEVDGGLGHQLLALDAVGAGVGRADGAQARVEAEQVGAEAHAHGQERQPLRPRPGGREEHPLVELGARELDPVWRAALEVRGSTLPGHRVVERDEGVDQPAHPAGASEDADVGPAVADDRGGR
jgi:hypothetical protein